MKILLTAVGKRVQLIKHLQTQFEVIGVDTNDKIAAKAFVDCFEMVPEFCEENYIGRLLEICKYYKIEAIIPLYEKEFLILANNRKAFSDIGTELILSNKKIIEICNDKKYMHEFFEKENIRCPKLIRDVEENIRFPLIIKPRDGMGSSQVVIVKTKEELVFFKKYIGNSIIEEHIDGTEYTIDILCDFQGKPIYIVPRERIEVRSGEVTKSKIIKDKNIVQATANLLDKLNAIKELDIGVMGPMTIQCFKEKSGEIIFLEINPRFGGGVPLSFEAGVNYALALKQLLKGQRLMFKDHYKELMMIRFDDAIFTE